MKERKKLLSQVVKRYKEYQKKVAEKQSSEEKIQKAKFSAKPRGNGGRLALKRKSISEVSREFDERELL